MIRLIDADALKEKIMNHITAYETGIILVDRSDVLETIDQMETVAKAGNVNPCEDCQEFECDGCSWAR